MEIKVDFDELKNVANTINNDKSELEVEINKLLESLERLKLIWYGDDFDQFYNKAFEYINRMKVLTSYLETTSSFINTSSLQYEKQDDNFSSDLDREVIENE